MIKTRIRFVALDLDGTLVGTNLTISQRVQDSIARARAQGTQITIVTGRMFAATKPCSDLAEKSEIFRVPRFSRRVRAPCCAKRRSAKT